MNPPGGPPDPPPATDPARQAGPRQQGRAGVKEVAARAGTGISSVSRVLSGHPHVSQTMRERVLTAAQELGYEPDLLARSLRRGASHTVGFVLSSIDNPVHAQLVAGAEAVLREHGYALLLVDSENDPALDREHIRVLTARRADGLLMALASDQDARTHDVLRQRRLPVVAVDRELPTDVCSGAVVTDHLPGMTAALNHLLGMGHRRIGLVSGSRDILPARARLTALKSAIDDSGAACELIERAGSFTALHGESATYEFLDMPQPPSALIIGGNLLLVGCLTALIRRGVEAGADVALVTCDDVALGELYRPPISAITRDLTLMGRRAAELLLRAIWGDNGRETIALPTAFVRRGSSRLPGPGAEGRLPTVTGRA